ARYRLRKFVRRNKRVLATATVLGMALLVAVGAVAWAVGWANRDRAARQARAASDLELALDRAEMFLGQGKRLEAMTALDRAELLAGEAIPGAALQERLGALRERLAAAARDQAFLARFEDILQRVETRFDLKNNKFDDRGALPEIIDALRPFGIAVGVT